MPSSDTLVAGLIAFLLFTWGAIGHIYYLRDKDRRDRAVELLEALQAMGTRFDEVKAAIAENRKTIQEDRNEAWKQRERLAREMVTRDQLREQTDTLMAAIRGVQQPGQRWKDSEP